MSWPADETYYGPEQYEGICSETLERVVDKRSGRTRLQWKKIGRANEALDVLVYSARVRLLPGHSIPARRSRADIEGKR